MKNAMKMSKNGAMFAVALASALRCAPVDSIDLDDIDSRAQDLSEIPASVTSTAGLGRAYDSQRKKLFFRNCVTGESRLGGNRHSSLSIERNMSFDAVIEALDGNLSVGFTLPVIKADAGATVANNHSATALSETHHLVWVGVAETESLLPESVRPVDRYLGRPDLLESRCGNEFITEIYRGASILATLRLEFVNREDREALGGKLNVVLPTALVNFGAGLSDVDQGKLQRTTLSVQVEQRGGAPEGLLDIVPTNVMTCTLENRDPCLTVFSELITYLKEVDTGFAAQLGRGSFNVLKYQTQSYLDSEADALVPDAYSVLDRAVRDQLELTEQSLRAAMADKLRAHRVLANTGLALDEEQRSRLLAIAEMASDNVIALADVSAYCYDHMDSSCFDYEGAARTRVHGPKRDGGYDRLELEIKVSGANASCDGCLIGASCVPSGTQQPGNACRMCEPSVSSTDFSPVGAGTTCGASGRACAGASTCDSFGTCQERPALDGTPCDDGQFCSEQSHCNGGACVATALRECGDLSICDEARDGCACSACRGANGACTLPRVWYRDADGDGFGDPSSGETSCQQPAGFIAGPATDCCDADANAKPGQTGFFSSVNRCNNWDYDCNVATSFKLSGCTPGSSTRCGCLDTASCTPGSCGTPQNVQSCQASGPYGQVVCSTLRAQALECR